MKFTLAWLKEHLQTDASLETIGETLTRIGLEVESIEDPGARLAPFTVAYVAKAERHPNADKLQVCTVETKDGTLQIVCGAPNARAGMKAAYAPVGSTIPATGTVLKTGVIRGVASNGMLCSARELGLGEEHDGILDLATDLPVGAPLAQALGLTDPVIDVAITPNRGDCNGVAGIARDLAAAGLGHVVTPEVESVPGRFPSPIGTHTDDTSACPMFAGRLIRGVRNGPSPPHVQARLKAVGLRPISALVDVTNLISLDRARPLHVFDAATLKGDLRARLSGAGESVAALDGKTYDLPPGAIVIADAARAVGIAGVMGGIETGCTDATTDVFIEAALFDPGLIARAGRALGINSDARYRFERGVDPEFCLDGLELATRLILDWCGGEPSEVVVAGGVPAWRREIGFDLGLVKRLTGLDLPAARILQILGDIGCRVTGAAPFKVMPPSWRPDLHGPADLVEEVTRLHGLDNLPATPLPRPAAVTRAALDAGQRRKALARRALASRGLVECVSYSFVPKAQAALFGATGNAVVEVANPISADLDAMRPSVLPSLLQAASRNAARGISPAALFEIGPQFFGAEPGQQSLAATGLRAGEPARAWTGKPPAPDVFAAKADAIALIEALGGPAANLTASADAPDWYHPGRSGCLRLGPKVVATFGELHPRVLAAFDLKGPAAAFEVLVEAIPSPKAKPTRTKPALAVSPYPAVERDFAFLVEARVAAAEIVKAAAGADKALIEGVEAFDVYQGERLEPGRKSVAVAVRLQPKDRTLTESDIDAVSAKIVAAVAKATGAALRS